MSVMFWGILVGVLGLTAANTSDLIAAVGVGILIFLSAFSIGCFLGFLFGVPRVLSKEQPGSAPPVSNTSNTPENGQKNGISTTSISDATSATGSKLLQSNTNLERISDWLTTMLVGAGLVELHRINDGLIDFRDFLESSATVFVHIDGTRGAGVIPVIGPIVLVFGIACGFLFMYLNTRLVLVRLFYAIEALLSGSQNLPSSEQRAVKAAATDESTGVSNFIHRQFESKRNVTVDDALNIMFDLLYKSSPDRVIDLGAQLSNSVATNRADYWFYLAAAFGQKLQALEADTADWASARDNALDCARRAVAIDQSYRNRLWYISDPNGSDNDLAPLRKDPEFLRIVRRD